jgi:protocatechuate 3,4-dioxygenase alpha subunit
MAELTPSQTVGPFFHLGLAWPRLSATAGSVTVSGLVLDGAGAPVPDALIELWQADAQGQPQPHCGLQRVAVDGDGRFGFSTVKPGAAGTAAPHLVLAVFARGLLRQVHTRLYFPEDTALHGDDPVLQGVPAVRRATLIAQRDGAALRFDIHLQGPQETVFFDV